MTRLLRYLGLALLLLCSVALLAQTKIPVTGHIGAIGADPANNTVYTTQFQLAYCGANVPRVFGSATVAETTATFQAASNGYVSGLIWPNDILTCGGVSGGTRYNVSFLVNGSRVGPTQCFQVLSTAGTFNLDSAQPCATVPPPIGPVGAPDALARNLTLSGLLAGGSAQFSGNVTAGSYQFLSVLPHFVCPGGQVADQLLFDLTFHCVAQTAAGLTSFNGRAAAAAVLVSTDVNTALGYTAANTSGVNAVGTWPIAITGNAATSSALAGAPGQCSGATPIAAGIQANGSANCIATPTSGPQTESFRFTGCPPAASTDGSCTGSFNLPTAMADLNYTIEMTTESTNGAFLYSFPTAHSATGINYTCTCTFNCAAIVAPTLHIYVRHD